MCDPIPAIVRAVLQDEDTLVCERGHGPADRLVAGARHRAVARDNGDGAVGTDDGVATAARVVPAVSACPVPGGDIEGSAEGPCGLLEYELLNGAAHGLSPEVWSEYGRNRPRRHGSRIGGGWDFRRFRLLRDLAAAALATPCQSRLHRFPVADATRPRPLLGGVLLRVRRGGEAVMRDAFTRRHLTRPGSGRIGATEPLLHPDPG
jgi:hypothetical protein